jgi:cell wall-associated NlpC family hydrolase
MLLPTRHTFAYILGSAALAFASHASFGAEQVTVQDPIASMFAAPVTAIDVAPAPLATFPVQDLAASIPAQPLSVRERAGALVENALGFIGVKYRRGGSAPETGFDCSGLVRYVFHDAWGLDLPRRAEEISHIGEKIGKDQLQPGDLVFYSTVRKAVSHVGIYLGDGQFVHAPSRGEQVRVEDMNQPYWTKRFAGARRVSQEDVAQR